MGIAENEIVDIELQSPRKKFRINGDNSQIIELNPADLNIISRLREVYKKLNEFAAKAGSLLVDKEEATDEEQLNNIADMLEKLDSDMKELIDYLFDSPISGVVAKNQSMYSLVNGEFWFEHVIEVLSGLYESNFKEEFKKMSAKMRKHTDKYTGKK